VANVAELDGGMKEGGDGWSAFAAGGACSGDGADAITLCAPPVARVAGAVGSRGWGGCVDIEIPCSGLGSPGFGTVGDGASAVRAAGSVLSGVA